MRNRQETHNETNPPNGECEALDAARTHGRGCDVQPHSPFEGRPQRDSGSRPARPRNSLRHQSMKEDTITQPRLCAGDRRISTPCRVLESAVIALVAALTAMLPITARAQSGSNAANYNSGAHLSISSRTGGVTVSFMLFKLPGIVSEMDASLTLTYRSDDAQSDVENRVSYFGLPYGWSLGLSFIDNRKAVIDGSQTYMLNNNWTTAFSPTKPGATPTPVSARTGLLQYNRADARLITLQPGQVTVNGVPALYAFYNIQGTAQYFSANGLLLRHADRFGNHMDYEYSNMNGTPRTVRLTKIIDTWGHEITFEECQDTSQCLQNETVIHLPAGRTAGWVPGDLYTISEFVDTEGMVTHLGWQAPPCAHPMGGRVLHTMTTPSGGMTRIDYTCLDVCTQRSSTRCEGSDVTTWSVASKMVQCPNNPSGQVCPAEGTNDYETTNYRYATANNDRNYTGYPLYSPYDTVDPNADALMESSSGGFVYTTVTNTERASAQGDGEIIHEVESDYNFVHVMQEQRVYVKGDSGLEISKITSYCYSLASQPGADDCPMDIASYQSLPANYQLPVMSGSCQFNLGDTSSGRLSIMSMEYDSFGNTVNKKLYHGTATTGIMDCTTRAARLNPSGLKLVRDEYMMHDTPTTLDANGFVEVGPGSGHYGLPLGQLSFIYLDDDESGVNAYGPLGDTQGPVLVKLMCNTLTDGPIGEAEEIATNIKSTTHGLLSNDTAKPTSVGLIDQCTGDTTYDESVAPPKKTTYTYDINGRGLGQLTEWAGTSQTEGITFTSNTIDYDMVDTVDGEEACDAGQVLQVTATDSEGNITVNRLCTDDGFHLSSIDANGHQTFMEHSRNGMTTKTTQANGTFVTNDYFYACPIAQDGSTATCPSFSTVDQHCPSDYDPAGRNCTVHTMNAGDGNSSYLDGVISVAVRDGLGRVVATLDDTGGGDNGSGFNEVQLRSQMTYDDRDLLTSKSTRMGSNDREPLIYKTTSEFEPKLRPKLVCGPRGEAHEFIHDDVNQKTKTVYDGTDREAYTLNDNEKLTSIANCDVVDGASTTDEGQPCPTTAADTSSMDCAGDAYMTYTLNDGSGVPHSITASVGNEPDDGASVMSVNGTTTFSADMLKYGYSYTSNVTGTGAVTASSTFVRDLQGQKLHHTLSITTDETKSFSSDSYAFNEINELLSEKNKLSTDDVTLQETYEYNPMKQLTKLTSYEGVDFNDYYDDLNRLVRHCFQPPGEDAQGERLTLDPITGATLRIAKFTNPNGCSEDDSGDVETGVFEQYTYNRFGSVERIDYSDGTFLEWAFDRYQRPTCFADALATSMGNECPDSPTDTNFLPDSSQLLVSYSYYPDDDPYRRGLMKTTCRGVPDGNGGTVTKCMETDYYTPLTQGGFCDDTGLSNVTGAFAGMVMTEKFCSGTPCDDSNTIYTTTHLYDEHRRPCVVESVNADGNVILSSSFRYDQYDNVVHEESRSDLVDPNDPSYDDSNYQIDYTYDGLLRMIEKNRQDLDGNLIKDTTYKYDAASNLTDKVETLPDEAGTEDTPTPIGTTPATPGPSQTVPAATATVAPATPVPTATTGGQPEGDDSCQIAKHGGANGWILLLPLSILIVLRRRSKAKA
jgi:hypothetical protein